MPELDMIFSRGEHAALVRFVFACGAWLVPSKLATPEVEKLKDIDAYAARVEEGEKLFHIQHPQFDRAPVEIRRPSSTEQTRPFYVVQRNGGPTVDLFGPFDFEEGGRRRVAGGSLSYYPTFWNPLTAINEPAPAEQKAFYTLVSRYVRQHSKRINAGKRNYWVGLTTLAHIERQEVALPSSWEVRLEI